MDYNIMKKKLKALIITDVTAPGGVDIYIRDLVRVSKKRGWIIKVLIGVSEGSNQLYKILKDECIDVLRKELYHGHFKEDKIRKNTEEVIEEYNPDIVHVVCGSPRSAIIPRMTALRCNLPLIFTESYVDPNFKFTEEQKNSIQYLYKNANKIITVCNENAELLRNKYGFSSSNLISISNSINTDKIGNYKQYFLKEKYNFLCVGRFTSQKGYDVLVKSIKLIPDEVRKSIKITIFGDGPDFESISKYIRENMLSEYFDLQGWVNDVEERLLDYDIFLMPSRFEGQPIALIEAMAYGLPCIASNVSGISELFNYGDYGTLVESENCEMLANEITSFINNSEPFNIKAKLAIPHIKKNHNLNKNMGKVIDIWESEVKRS